MSRHLQDIAITTNSLRVGGAENQRVILANEMAAMGHSVVIYCLQDRGALSDDVCAGVDIVERDWKKGLPGGHEYVISGTTNTEVAFALLGRLRRRKARWLVAIHNPIGPSAPKLAMPARVGMKFADVVASLTPEHASKLRHYWGMDSQVQLPNALSNAIFCSIQNQSRRREAAGFDLGYIGRISAAHKGLDRLFQALAEPAASTLTLAIAGTGPDEDDLRALAADLGIDVRIHWLGHQSPSDFFNQIDVLVLMSRYEGQPLVLLEAEAAQVKVVASSTSGAVSDHRTHVVEYESPRLLAEALRDVRTINHLATHPLPEQQYTSRHMAEKYLKALADIKLEGGVAERQQSTKGAD